MSLLDRRAFTKLSALTLAATRLAAQKPATSITGAPTLSKPVGFAPVGLGYISDIFMKACDRRRMPPSRAWSPAIPPKKAPRYASQYNVPQGSIYTYETYDKIRDNPAIEAVYIGLPNSMHAEYTIRAAEAGKHVLCEKPMAISSAECRKMIDACSTHDVKLMIAYRVHYDPTWQHIRDLATPAPSAKSRAFKAASTAPNAKANGVSTANSPAAASCSTSASIHSTPSAGSASEEPTTIRAQVATKIRGRASRGRGDHRVQYEVPLRHPRQQRQLLRQRSVLPIINIAAPKVTSRCSLRFSTTV